MRARPEMPEEYSVMTGRSACDSFEIMSGPAKVSS